MNSKVVDVTERIKARSLESRTRYLEMVDRRRPERFARLKMSEGNLAHASAGCAVMEKAELLGAGWPNIGIITSYNDMLSAHAPFEDFPEIIREAARDVGADCASGRRVFLRCVMALRKAKKAWSYHCSRVM